MRMLVVIGAMMAISLHSTAASTPMATPAVRDACISPDGNGLIVYLNVDVKAGSQGESGAASSLVVFGSDGTELHRTPVNGVPTIYPLGVRCTAIVNGEDDQALLFDGATGDLRTLTTTQGETPERLYPAIGWFQRGDEQRWAVMTDGDIKHPFLLDTETATLTDLTAVISGLRGDDQLVVILGATFTPDQHALLLATDRDTWLFDPSNPSDARLIDGVVVGRVSLSNDGTRIAYLAKTVADSYKVVTERLDGTDRQTFGDADRGAAGYWIGDNADRLLVIDGLGGPGSVREYNDGAERVFDLDLPGYLAGRPLVAPTGNKVLLRVDDGGIAWVWLDLDSGESKRLTDLDGYGFPYSGQRTGLRWLTFSPSEMSSVEPDTIVRSVDMETGIVSDLLTFDVEETYFGISPTANFGISADGRYVAINDFGKDYPRFWLLDAESGTSTEYAGQIAGMFSPDGSQLIVSGPSGGADERVWTTSIVTVDGDPVVTLAESAGRGGYWLPILTQ